MCQKQSAHLQMAMSLAKTISLASWLGKTACNQEGKSLAYQVKGAKLSAGLIHFGEHFKVVSAERHVQFGILLLVRLPNGFGAHIPLMSLSPAAQMLIHGGVVELLEGGALSMAA